MAEETKEFEPITLNSQEEVDALFKERFQRVEKKYEGWISPSDFETQKAELEKGFNDSLSQKQNEFDTQLKELNSKISTYESNSAKRDIADSYGLSKGAIKYIQGSTKEEMEDSAKELSSMFSQRRNPPEKGSSNTKSNPYQRMVANLKKE